jgi:granule-bound starch synthase
LSSSCFYRYAIIAGAVQANGHRVMVISPRYDQYKDAWDTGVISEVRDMISNKSFACSRRCCTFHKHFNLVLQIKMGDEYERVRFFHCYKRGVDRVFIDHPSFLEKVIAAFPHLHH